MDEWIGQVVILAIYLAYALLKYILKGRESPAGQAPGPEVPESPTPLPRAPIPPPASIAETWRDMDRRAADVAALPDLFAVAEAAHQSGRVFFRVTLGLEPELRARMGLPRAAPLPNSLEGMTVRHLALPLGPWLPTLFADAFAIVAMGPAYVVGLRRRLAPAGSERAATVDADETGTSYGPTPPAHLRVLLCCDLLAQLGHTAEASRQLSLWQGTMGPIEDFLIPTADGMWIEAPVDPPRDFGGRVHDVIVAEPLSTLGNRNLAQLPGLRFSAHQQSAAEAAALTIGRGQPVRVEPRVALAAALLAADELPGHEARIHDALRRSLAPSVEAARQAPPRPGQAPPRPRQALPRPPRPAEPAPFLQLSPAAIREAIVARAVLWR